MKKPFKPSFCSAVEEIPSSLNIYQSGEGDKIRFNMIQFVCFTTTWLIKISICVKSQPFCFIVFYRDAYGGVRYSNDNLYTIEDNKQGDALKDYINGWIAKYEKKEILAPENIIEESKIK
jgi:hypothetical protein